MKRTFSSSKKTKGLTWHVWFTKMVGIANGILKSPNAFRRFGLILTLRHAVCTRLINADYVKKKSKLFYKLIDQLEINANQDNFQSKIKIPF